MTKKTPAPAGKTSKGNATPPTDPQLLQRAKALDPKQPDKKELEELLRCDSEEVWKELNEKCLMWQHLSSHTSPNKNPEIWRWYSDRSYTDWARMRNSFEISGSDWQEFSRREKYCLVSNAFRGDAYNAFNAETRRMVLRFDDILQSRRMQPGYLRACLDLHEKVSRRSCGYVTPMKIEEIRGAALKANDHEFVTLIDRQVAQRTEAMSLPRVQANTIITPDIRLWLEEKQKILAPGKKLPKLPRVHLSEEDPPAFRQNHRLKNMYYEEDHEKGELDEADVESLLGCYIFSQRRIIIWRKGVVLCAEKLHRGQGQRPGILYDNLLRCVLVHELGHWFNAEAFVPSGATWDPTPLTLTVAARTEPPVHPDHTTPEAFLPASLTGDARSLSSRSYHEVWAQLFAWLYGHEADDGVLTAFEALEQRQSTPYHAWRKLVSVAPSPGPGPYGLHNLRYPLQRILDSLRWSRTLKDAQNLPAPATFNDPNFPRTNMLGWL
jgi:hypothetical protein